MSSILLIMCHCTVSRASCQVFCFSLLYVWSIVKYIHILCILMVDMLMFQHLIFSLQFFYFRNNCIQCLRYCWIAKLVHKIPRRHLSWHEVAKSLLVAINSNSSTFLCIVLLSNVWFSIWHVMEALNNFLRSDAQ